MRKNSGIYRGFNEEVLENWKLATWKDNIINMTPQQYQNIYGNQKGYYSDEFTELKDFLKQTDDIDVSKMGETTKFRSEIEKNSKLKNAFEKYGFDIFQSEWDYIYSSEVLETEPVDTTHRLYI